MTKVNRRTSKGIIGVVLVLLSMLTLFICTTAGNSPSVVYAITFRDVSEGLGHQPVSPSGKPATLFWDHKAHTLKVDITLQGLAPNSTHPAHIHSGLCSKQGPVLFPLTNVVADGTGVGTSETILNNMKDGIQAHGWLINVHNGPNLTPADQFTPITCGDIVDEHASTANNESLNVPLGEIRNDLGQAAHGTVKLSVNNKQLTVEVTISDLAPNSTHIDHIHSGSCAKQGSVLFTLNPIVADRRGKADITTVLKNVSAIPKDAYVNVHQGATSGDLGTQTGFDPIACADIH